MSYTAAQIAEALGVTKQGISYRVKKESWPSTKRPGKGGGRLFALSDLPVDVRDAVLAWELAGQGGAVAAPAVPAAVQNLPAVAERPTDTSQLNTKQRGVMCARLAFVREIDRLVASGLSKTVVMDNLVEASRRGALAGHLLPLVVVANDRSGGERGLSTRSLQRWMQDFRHGGEAALAPARAGRDMAIPAWAGDFLAVYQRPSRQTLADCYRQVFGLPHAPNPGAPSIHAVRRFMGKLSIPAREQGRMTGNARLSILAHRKRDTSAMWPTDCFTMDGTTFDSEIQHPHTGQPWKPEITIVLDVATRRCVGLSVALSESAISTLDAIRMACLFGGIPAILHADNGPGYKNSIWTAEGTGLMARLGIELRNSIPGRPQGKGLMERAIGTICVSAAKRLSSCMHASSDKDAAKKVFKLSRQALKRGGNLLPTWDEFKAVILARVEEYNATPHRGLPKFQDPATGVRRHYAPNEYWQSFLAQGFEPVTVPDHLKDELFLPAEHRKVRRGKITFLTGEYFHKDLEELHGEMVEVRYDIWDASTVQIWSLDGVRICTAERDGHAAPYFDRTVQDIGNEKRRKAQLKRLEDKAQRIESGATIALPEADPGYFSDELAVGRQPQVIDVTPEQAPPINARPLFTSSMHHYRWLMEHRDQCTDTDETWLAGYAQTAEYADMADRYAFEKIAWTPASPAMAQES